MKHHGADMITIDIPGWGNMDIENILLDLNGTLAIDGKIRTEARGKINALSDRVTVYILTADTQGTADEEMRDLKARLIKLPGEGSKNGKFEFIRDLEIEKTVVVGNGNNDQLILKEAALGIAVLGDEGMSVSAMQNADIVVKSIFDALDLFLKPKRLLATLRE
jgi:soluble P-type ATPase